MKLQQYQNEVKRTCPDLGSLELNKIHMILGLNSEFNELMEAIEKNDKVNIGEELTDKAWYLLNYCNLINLDLWRVFSFDKENYNYIQKNDDYVIQLQIAISKLTDLEKKSFAYKKQIHKAQLIDHAEKIAMLLNDCYIWFELDVEECMERNINKLRIRFPEKFSEDLANNRQLDKEREKLEGK